MFNAVFLLQENLMLLNQLITKKENSCALKCTENDNERENIENGNSH